MFRLSGIRETFDVLNEELALKLGNIFGQHMKDTIVVARDGRKTSDLLANALKSGILAAGKNVINIGKIPTPVAEFYAEKHSHSLFVITASHNPPEYNGLKIKPNKIFLKPEESQQIWETTSYKRVGWKEVGQEKKENAIPLYVNSIIEHIKSIDFPIIVDFGGGVVSNVFKAIASKLKLEALYLNDEIDPFFSSRPSEPKKEHLSELIKVCKEQAKIGVAFDGDGDRMVLIDERGNYWGGNETFALFTYLTLKREKDPQSFSVISTISTSKALDFIANTFGANIIHTKVGVSYITEKLMTVEKGIAGESSGGFVCPEFSLSKDGIFSALKLLSMLEMPLYQYWDVLPKLHSISKDLVFRDPSIIIEKLKPIISEKFTINTTEGIRVDESDGWFLIRASKTEPKLRIFVEYKDKEKAQQRFNYIMDLIKSI